MNAALDGQSGKKTKNKRHLVKMVIFTVSINTFCHYKYQKEVFSGPFCSSSELTDRVFTFLKGLYTALHDCNTCAAPFLKIMIFNCCFCFKDGSHPDEGIKDIWIFFQLTVKGKKTKCLAFLLLVDTYFELFAIQVIMTWKH